MQVDPKGTLFGHPALKIRRLLRRFGNWSYSDGYLEEVLGISAAAARRLRRDLVAEGYLQRDASASGKAAAYWKVAMAGAGLAMASAARPITRATATKRLEAFLERVAVVNATNDFAQRVARVAIFGSYLTEAPRVNDVDLMLHFVERDRASYQEHSLKRIGLAIEQGRQFPNISSEYNWPRDEIMLFLRARTRTLSLHDWQCHEGFLDARPHRLLYVARDAPPTPEEGRRTRKA